MVSLISYVVLCHSSVDVNHQLSVNKALLTKGHLSKYDLSATKVSKIAQKAN